MIHSCPECKHQPRAGVQYDSGTIGYHCLNCFCDYRVSPEGEYSIRDHKAGKSGWKVIERDGNRTTDERNQ